MTDAELYALILDAEDELFRKGLDPKARSFQVPITIMEKLGHKQFILLGHSTPPLLDRIRALHSKLYRQRDVAVGLIHAGVFSFRGIVGMLEVKQAFGTVDLSVFEQTDFTYDQIRWIEHSGKTTELINAYVDVFDMAMTIEAFDGFKLPKNQSSRDYFRNACFHHQSATSSLCSMLDRRGAVQAAIIGSELALKAALMEKSVPAKELKKLGHNQKAIGKRLSELCTIDVNALEDAVDRLPQYVENRYSAEQPSEMETAQILMAAQCTAAIAARTVTGNSLINNLIEQSA